MGDPRPSRPPYIMYMYIASTGQYYKGACGDATRNAETTLMFYGIRLSGLCTYISVTNHGV